jgi:hypothetical protein
VTTATWTTFRAAVAAAVVAASEQPAGAVVWDKSGLPIADPVVRLSVTSAVDLTEPREVRTEREAGDYAVALSVLRDVAVQIRCESVHAATVADAQNLASWIALGLQMQEVQVALHAAGIALIDSTGNTDLSYWDADRLIYARTFDALFRAEFERSDPTALGVLEHVKISGEVDAPPAIAIPEETISRPAA